MNVGESIWFVEAGKSYMFLAIGRFIIGKVAAVSPVAVKLEPGAVWVRQTGNDPRDMYRTGIPQEFFEVPCTVLYFHDLQSVDAWEHPLPKH